MEWGNIRWASVFYVNFSKTMEKKTPNVVSFPVAECSAFGRRDSDKASRTHDIKNRTRAHENSDLKFNILLGSSLSPHYVIARHY